MKIFAVPDPEEVELDPVDPLGSICIRVTAMVVEFTDRYRMHKNWPKCKTLVAVRDWALDNQAG
jgi:hypothetical protein